MRYLIIAALLALSFTAKSQPYPSSHWPDPLPTSNLNMVKVMIWMMDNGEIDRLDLFVSNSGVGQYIRKPVSMDWLYNKSRLIGTPIKLSSWAGYAVAPPSPREIHSKSSVSWSSGATNPPVCTQSGAMDSNFWTDPGVYDIVLGVQVYSSADGFRLRNTICKIEGNRWIRTDINSIVVEIGYC